MELLDLTITPTGNISDFKPDLFIAASGYEARSVLIPKSLNNPGRRKIALAYTEYTKEFSRRENDLYFKNNDYELIYSPGFRGPDFHTVFNGYEEKELKILIDISVMTRNWYHALLKYINTTRHFSKLTVRAVYCPVLMEESVELRRKIIYDKVHLIENVRDTGRETKATALILGLGSEIELGNTVFEKLKPKHTTLLYADSIQMKQYVENVFINNHALIERISIRNLIGYPLNNPWEIYKILLNLILPLRMDYQITIVPEGPKILSLITMLLQFNYPDIELIIPRFKVKQLKEGVPFHEFTYIDLKFGIE
ncbi:MAG: hypothetical protein WD052_12505 [Bacteroidales bacterium]